MSKSKLDQLIEEEREKQKNLPKNFKSIKSPTELSETYNNNKERFIPMLKSLLSVSNIVQVENYLKMKTNLHGYKCSNIFPISHDILSLIIYDRTNNDLSEDMFNKIIVEFKNGYKIHANGINNLIDNNFKFFMNKNQCFYNFVLQNNNNNADKATNFIEKALKILSEFQFKVTSDN